MSIPVINSSLVVGGYVGTPFSYSITATNSPTTFGATSLPSWMSINTATGVLSGTPDAPIIVSPLKLTATNVDGQGKANLYLHIVEAGASLVTSASTATAVVGTPFTYTITGSNTPTAYNQTGMLPSGLSFNPATGVISGTPTTPQVKTPLIYVSNANGTDHIALTITVNSGAGSPVINSAATIATTIGLPFTYTITASNTPTSFGASGLPSGLSVNTSTGVISGSILVGGTYTPTISATNGTGTGNLVLTITANVPTSVVCPTGISFLNTSGAEIPALELANPLIDIITLAYPWSLLQPTSSSSYDWSYLDRNIAAAANAGKFVLIRVGTGGGFSSLGGKLPDWLAPMIGLDPTSNEIVTGVSYTLNSGATVITIPVYWNPTFVTQKIQLYQALGDYLTNTTTLTPMQKSMVKVVGVSFTNATSEDWNIPSSTLLETTGGPDGTGYDESELDRWATAGYDSNVLLNVGIQLTDAILDACPGQLATLAIAGNGPSLDAAVGGADPTNWMATTILDYQKAAHPDRLIVQRQSVSSKQQPAPPPSGSVWKPLYDYTGPHAGQMLWFVSGDATLRVNGGTRDDIDGVIPNPPGLTDQQILDKSGVRASGYSMKYLEVYKSDLESLDITPTRNLLYSGTVTPEAPVITSSDRVTGQVGSFLSYQIEATHTPASFGGGSLPNGLTVNTSTGVISGTPTLNGNTTSLISATNAQGTGTLAVLFHITPNQGSSLTPTITSPLVASVVAGQPFTYQITATNSPTSYSGSGTPAGITANTMTGVLSGTSGIVGSYTIHMKAYNASGFGEADLVLNVVEAGAPVVTLDPRYTPVLATPYYLRTTTDVAVDSYDATGLPDGLGINVVTGEISGTPTQALTYNSVISATNSHGTGSLEVIFSVTTSSVTPEDTVKRYSAPEISVFAEDTLPEIIIPGPVLPNAPYNLVVLTPGIPGSTTAVASWTPPTNSQ